MSNFDPQNKRSKTLKPIDKTIGKHTDKATFNAASRSTHDKVATSDDSQPANNAKTRWTNLRSTLEFASAEWEELDNQAPTKSPEEEQFEKVKSIIENLKDKLSEF